VAPVAATPPVVPTDTLPALTVTVPPSPADPALSALAPICPLSVAAPSTLTATEPPCEDPLAATLPVELTVNVWAASVTVPPMAGTGLVCEGVAPAVTLPSTTTAPAA